MGIPQVAATPETDNNPAGINILSPDNRIVIKHPESTCVVVFDPNGSYMGGSSTVPFDLEEHPSSPEEFLPIACKALNETQYGKYKKVNLSDLSIIPTSTAIIPRI